MITDALDNWIILAIAAGGAIAGGILVWLMVISTRGYSPEDAEAHASDYGNVVREGHGPMVLFLWATFLAALVFVIVTWVIYWPMLNETIAR